MSIGQTRLATNTVVIDDFTPREIIPEALVGASETVVLLGYTAINEAAGEQPVIQLETTTAPVELVDYQVQPGDPLLAANIKESGIVRRTFSPPIVLPEGSGLSGRVQGPPGVSGDVFVTARFALKPSRLRRAIIPLGAPFVTDALEMTFDGAAEYIDCDALLAGIFPNDPITAFTILAFTDGMLQTGPVTIFSMDLGTVAGGLNLTVNSAEVWALQLNSGGGLIQTFVGVGSKLKDEPQVLAAVYDGTESVALNRGRLYLQDASDLQISEVSYNPATGSQLASHPQAASPHGYVGAEPGVGGTPAFFLDGTIGSFAIWDVALTLAELVLCIDGNHKPTNLAALAVPPALWLRMGDAPLDAPSASSLENVGTAGGSASPVAMDASNYVVWP